MVLQSKIIIMYTLNVFFLDAKTTSKIKGFQTSIMALNYYQTIKNKAVYLGIEKTKALIKSAFASK